MLESVDNAVVVKGQRERIFKRSNVAYSNYSTFKGRDELMYN